MSIEASLFPATGAAFVAGGSGGIGSAICKRLARSGARVVLTYKTKEAKARAVVDEITAQGGQARAVPLALEDADAVKAAVDMAAETSGGIHTVIYATGPFVPFRFVSRMEPAEMQTFLNVDTMACFNLMHAALPHLRAAKGSALAVTTCAIDRWANQDGLSAIPKAAVNAIMRGIAKEEGRFGIRSNMVALGIIEAGMFTRSVSEGHIDDTYLAAMSKNLPLQRPGRAEEVAEAAHFLTSSLASYTTGQVLQVDGGWNI